MIKKLLILLLVIIVMAVLFFVVKNYFIFSEKTDIAKIGDNKKESPQDIALQNIIKADIASQNSHNFEDFLGLRSENKTMPESKYNYLSIYNSQKKEGIFFMDRIVSAKIVGIKEIPLKPGGVITGPFKYPFDEMRMFYVGIDYTVTWEDKYIFNGINYRLYVLGKEGGKWVIIEASSAPSDILVRAGYGLGTEK